MSFATNPDTRRSITGYLFMMGVGAVRFGLATQTLTTQSTVEAELNALSYDAQEAVYFTNLLSELSFNEQLSFSHFNSDSKGILTLTKSRRYSVRIKHTARRFKLLEEMMKSRTRTVAHKTTIYLPSA